MNIYSILTYLGVIMFIIYAGISTSYYNNISIERMKRGNGFCIKRGDKVTPTKIQNSYMVTVILLILAIIVFIMKINNDIFSSCNYQEGKASGLLSTIASNTNFWWTFLILSIYAITIYELAILDEFHKCNESVTDTSGLIAVNSIVVGIISLMILMYIYFKFIKGTNINFMGSNKGGISETRV